MIARIAMDSEALLDFQEEPRRAAHVQSDIVEVLDEYSILELQGEADLDALFNAVKRLNPDLNQLWVQALKGLQTLNRVTLGCETTTMSDLCGGERLPADLFDRVDLVVVRESLADLRGIPTEKGHARRPSEPEVSLSDSVRRSATIQRLHQQRVRGIFAKGEEREAVWRGVFAAAAALSDEATILDRYFLTHLLTPKGPRRRDHHEWLLRRLDKAMKLGASLRVMSELPPIGRASAGTPAPRMAASDAERIIRRNLTTLVGVENISQVHIVLAPWPPRWQEGPHNRHIRFSCGVALSTSEGLDYLDNPKLISPFTWQAVTSEDRLGNLSSDERVILRVKDRVEVTLPEAAADVASQIAHEPPVEPPP